MKNLLLIKIILLSWNLSAQVAIGKATITNTSVSLEFGSANRGMILPWVSSAASVTEVVNGTMIYDLSDHKVKVKYSASWKDLSIDLSGSTLDPLTGVDGILIQNSATEHTNAKVAIGPLSSTSGILVLEDTGKAMILPKVTNPHLTIINPSAGLIVFDTTKKLLAVFNGKVWTFWKP